MSFQNASLPIQSFLNGYGNRDRTWAAIDFFLRLSMANNRIRLTEQQFTAGPGKLRTAKIVYVPIQCNVGGQCGVGLCADGTKIQPVVRDLDITQCTATQKYSLAQDDIRLTDNGQWDVSGYALEMIGSIMPEFRREIAKDMITHARTLVGLHSDGTSSKVLPLAYNPAQGTTTPVGMWEIEREYKDAGLNVPYILGGGRDFFAFRKAVESGGLDANGFYVNRTPIDNTWYDDGLQADLLNDVANGDWILAIDPQVFKMVTFLENVGQFATALTDITNINQLYKGASGPGRDFIETTITDTVTGLTFDAYFNFDKCTKTWDFHFELKWDFFVMPDINCNVQGFNGVTSFRTCPPVAIDCPAGSPAASPTASSFRNWNPAFTYPKAVYQVSIGGRDVSYDSPVVVTNDTDTTALLNDAFGAAIFSLSGANIRYSGFSNLSGGLNDGEVTITFAP